jgi:membrane protease YdiL (CAAX protease family)
MQLLLEKISYKLTSRKQVIVFFTGWLGLTIFSILVSIVILSIFLALENDNTYEMFLESSTFLSYVNFFTYLLLFFVILVIARPSLIYILRELLKLSSWSKGIGYGFLIILSSASLGIVYELLNVSINDNINQQTINTLVMELPIVSIITFTFLGPIVEEFTYRLGLFSFLARKSRWLAYGLTLVLFGLIHFNFTNPDLINESLNLPFYLIAGGLFCYIYEKNGFGVVTIAHITNNLVSVVSILLLANTGSVSS